ILSGKEYFMDLKVLAGNIISRKKR
ncbi:TPA_asm: glycosyl transferase, partial [Salmonella enterica subsp. enterica]|nr:glycosyl transferase [Salmonella enterica]ECH5915457.1 glycosyl transferase [Salmonella enterica]ECJ3264231.1 glycosyl transferase [Salmonella enterica]ECZ0771209.1 glycosyl transferase [Salmonella enterica]HAC6959126.1 glycosyl transferase [Salmonella enterica subsp. enterica]